MWTYKCDRCGAALDPGERCDCQDRPAKYNGKPIFTQENFNYSEAKIGDYVEQAVVDDAMDCLPPASMSAPGGPGDRAAPAYLLHVQACGRRVA